MRLIASLQLIETRVINLINQEEPVTQKDLIRLRLAIQDEIDSCKEGDNEWNN